MEQELLSPNGRYRHILLMTQLTKFINVYN